MKRAFTLIELLVVIGILGILMGIVVGTFSGSTESAQAAKCMSNMRNLANAVQSYAMRPSMKVYPRATNITKYKQAGKKDIEVIRNWLGDATTDPYETGEDVRENCFDNGAIWDGMKHARESYVCPSHVRHAKNRNKPVPLWSYAYNSHFDRGKADSGKPATGDVFQPFPLRRADRTLMFAELPFANVKIGATELQGGNPSADELDPVLKMDGSEAFGFNHKEGKSYVAHVCFADGHVEKLRAPKDSSKLKDLAKWLCYPHDASRGDFDVNFDTQSQQYVQDFSQATESAEE